ncbi:MAG: glucose-6-phosphate isomerase [Clostridia bacterium]|nr:glucose-6-phosphate isomerase [Clostridia bacterium]
METLNKTSENFISFDHSRARDFLKASEIDSLQDSITAAHYKLECKTGAGRDFTGWVDLPLNYDKEEFARVKECAERIRKTSQLLIVIGIGGSYLGAKAAIEALSDNFYNIDRLCGANGAQNGGSKGVAVLFAGNSLSSSYLSDITALVRRYDVSLNVISKSGTTTEPAVAFRVLKAEMEAKYGKKEAAKRIYATTDKARGALRQLATEEGYETFVIPDDVGGRYSVLTPVGLLPIAAAGGNIDLLMEGAKAAHARYASPDVSKNDCYAYAAARNALYRKGKTIELMVNYEPSLHYLTEWWKQLYGESEGKDGKGIFPAGVDFSTDLHSMGQYIQDGRRDLFETVLLVDRPHANLTIDSDPDNLDGLNYLAGKDVDYVNKQAAEGTYLAHRDGGVPNLFLRVPELSEFCLGQIVYFFEKACGISGYLLGVNPFDQPGVEAYKKNMFRLLGKPGY